MKNKLCLSDKKLMKTLITELKGKGYKFFSYKKLIYQKPFNESDFIVINSIVECVKKLEDDYLKFGLIYTLGVKGFDDAVPFLIDFYKEFLKGYTNSKDERLLQIICKVLYDIHSDKYIELYLELLKLKIVSATVTILDLLENIDDKSIESYIIPLIEKENVIPLDWIGWPNETDKYWFSENALIFIANKKKKEYKDIFEKFLTPEKLEFIHFTQSKYQKKNYDICYKRYKEIAVKSLNNFENKKTVRPQYY